MIQHVNQARSKNETRPEVKMNDAEKIKYNATLQLFNGARTSTVC